MTESLAKTVLMREKAAQFDPENHLLSCNSCRKVCTIFSVSTHLLMWCFRRYAESAISVYRVPPSLPPSALYVFPFALRRVSANTQLVLGLRALVMEGP